MFKFAATSQLSGISDSTGTSGFVIWFPDFTGSGIIGAGVNSGNFFHSNANLIGASAKPINTLGAPLGTDGSGLSTLSDPNYEFVATDVVKDFRTIGACLSFAYNGKLADCQGEICMTRISFNDLFNPDLETKISDPEVSNHSIFQYAGESTRFTPAGVEMVWTPDEESHTFADEKGPFTPLFVGAPTTVESTTTTTMIERNPMALVMAWRGMASDMPVTIRATKCFEWRPKTISGLSHVTPTTVAPLGITAKVTRLAQSSGLLDRVGDALTGGLMTATNRLASSVYNGIAGAVTGSTAKAFTTLYAN